jgi:threonine dehydratase
LWDGPLPTLHDVYRARTIVRHYLQPTPLVHAEGLSERLGFQVHIKCENVLPTGAFKVRGGLYYMSQLSEAQRRQGVVGASTGNHGQSLAYAARAFGSQATIFVPEAANPLKVALIRSLGAEVIHHGLDFDDCLVAARMHAAHVGAVFVHSADEPHLVAGVATHTLEIMEQLPDVDAVYVAIGGGSGLCGACIAGKGINPKLRVVGVQSDGAPAVRDSFRAKSLIRYDSMSTFAEGIATREAFRMPSSILWDTVDDIISVPDALLKQSMITVLGAARVLAEGAGAAGLAGAYAQRDLLAGKKVAVIVSGGNVTLDGLQQVLNEERAW